MHRPLPSICRCVRTTLHAAIVRPRVAEETQSARLPAVFIRGRAGTIPRLQHINTVGSRKINSALEGTGSTGVPVIREPK